MGVFFKKERFELLEMGQFWLSETPNVPASESWNVSLPRMVTWVRMKDKKIGKEFYFLDTHFAHRGQDEQARTESAKVIAAFIQKLPANLPLLLTGDDLIRHGLKPGEKFKEILESVRDAQLEGNIRSFDEALALVNRLH